MSIELVLRDIKIYRVVFTSTVKKDGEPDKVHHQTVNFACNYTANLTYRAEIIKTAALLVAQSRALFGGIVEIEDVQFVVGIDEWVLR